MRTSRFLYLAFIALTICSCAPIEHHAELDRPAGYTGTAGIGDAVVKVDKTRDLQNILGRADLYGRQTNEGYSALYFAGLDPTGNVILYRRDVTIVSNETTMSRTPFSSTYSTRNINGSATIVGNSIYGSATASGTSTTIHPVPEYHAVLPPDAIQITLPKGTTSLPFEGHTVIVESATPVALTYQVQN